MMIWRSLSNGFHVFGLYIRIQILPLILCLESISLGRFRVALRERTVNSDDMLLAIYNDMLDVMASGRPTGSTERLANELRKYLGLPEWPTLETDAVPHPDADKSTVPHPSENRMRSSQ